MMEAISGKAWMDRLAAEARSNFRDHKLTEIGPGHWRIKRPNESIYWAEIVVMSKVAIAVWGDIQGCFFAYCSGYNKPENVIAWLSKADTGYYGHQKASIGMGGIGVDEYVHEVALFDLMERLKEADAEYGEGDEERLRKYKDAIVVAIEGIKGLQNVQEMQESLMEDIREADQDAWEWIGDVGKVTSVRVIYALAAIARLHELLQEKAA